MTSTKDLTPPAIPPVYTQRLSHQLQNLVDQFSEKTVRLEEVVAVLHGRAYHFLLLILALPFCTPVPLPGLSTPFGVIIALIGLRLALGQKPWLPQRLLATSLPPKIFFRIFKAAQKIMEKLEKFLKPRWRVLVENILMRRLYGMLIFVCGAFLLLPLPIPFSNFFPALTIILLAIALVEGDGYFAAVALVIFTVTLSFFGLLLIGGINLLDWINK